jgi:SAM-dependent methyltransferase
MCIPSVLEWGERNLSAGEIRGRRVLEVGSYDVNGSLRSVVEPLGPAEYVGADIRPGPGVDVICQAEDLVERFGTECFDVVISTATLEHIRDWRRAVSNIKRVCRPGGLIVVVVPSAWPFHAYPNDFWRYEPKDVTHIFSDCEIILLEENTPLPHGSLVYAKIRKPDRFVESDLSSYQLYSIITGRRTESMRGRDLLSPRFPILAAEYALKTQVHPTLAKPLMVIVMGFKLRIFRFLFEEA